MSASGRQTAKASEWTGELPAPMLHRALRCPCPSDRPHEPNNLDAAAPKNRATAEAQKSLAYFDGKDHHPGHPRRAQRDASRARPGDGRPFADEHLPWSSRAAHQQRGKPPGLTYSAAVWFLVRTAQTHLRDRHSPGEVRWRTFRCHRCRRSKPKQHSPTGSGITC